MYFEKLNDVDAKSIISRILPSVVFDCFGFREVLVNVKRKLSHKIKKISFFVTICFPELNAIAHMCINKCYYSQNRIWFIKSNATSNVRHSRANSCSFHFYFSSRLHITLNSFYTTLTPLWNEKLNNCDRSRWRLFKWIFGIFAKFLRRSMMKSTIAMLV